MAKQFANTCCEIVERPSVVSAFFFLLRCEVESERVSLAVRICTEYLCTQATVLLESGV